MSAPAATDELKAEALRLYEEVGPSEASRRTGIKRTTISQWARRMGLVTAKTEKTQAARNEARKVWDIRRLVEADEAGATATKLRAKVEELAEANKASDARNMAVAYAIMIDKAQLLSGDVTGRQAFTATQPEQPKEPPATPADAVAEGRQRALSLVMPRATEGE